MNDGANDSTVWSAPLIGHRCSAAVGKKEHCSNRGQEYAASCASTEHDPAEGAA
jgi:hypothetical protein